MSGYIKNLGVILGKAQGVVDVDAGQPIDIGGEVLSIRQECDGLSRGILAMGAANDELRAKLAEAEQQRDAAAQLAINNAEGAAEHLRTATELRAEAARLASEVKRAEDYAAHLFSARESAEARLRELRQAVGEVVLFGHGDGHARGYTCANMLQAALARSAE